MSKRPPQSNGGITFADLQGTDASVRERFSQALMTAVRELDQNAHVATGVADGTIVVDATFDPVMALNMAISRLNSA